VLFHFKVRRLFGKFLYAYAYIGISFPIDPWSKSTQEEMDVNGGSKRKAGAVKKAFPDTELAQLAQVSIYTLIYVLLIVLACTWIISWYVKIG
jgi:hypothetical protein